MTKRTCFIRDREAIPEVAEQTGLSVIDLEYEFDKAEILGVVCTFEVELTDEQVKTIDENAKRRL